MEQPKRNRVHRLSVELFTPLEVLATFGTCVRNRCCHTVGLWFQGTALQCLVEAFQPDAFGIRLEYSRGRLVVVPFLAATSDGDFASLSALAEDQPHVVAVLKLPAVLQHEPCDLGILRGFFGFFPVKTVVRYDEVASAFGIKERKFLKQ